MKRLCVSLLLLGAGLAQAGNVITTGLPAGSMIVNIDARADGSASYSGPGQAFWYQPTMTAPSITLGPGSYTFTIMDPADAHAALPGLDNSQLAQIYTAWTFNSPWSEDYLVFDSAALTNGSIAQLFDGGLAPGDPATNTYGSAQLAYDGTKADGFNSLIRVSPLGRGGGLADYQAQLTLTSTTTLVFVVPDYALGDNTGGVSVLVTAVPEPSTLLLGLGSAAFLLMRRRARI